MWPYTAEENDWYDARRVTGPQTLPEIDEAEMRRLIARGRRMQSRVIFRTTRRAATATIGLVAGTLAAVRRSLADQAAAHGVRKA